MPSTSRNTPPAPARSGPRAPAVVAVGVSCLVAVGLAGVLLGHRTPPLDAWVLDHLHARPESATAAVATAISGVGTLAGVAMLVVGLVALGRRERGRGSVALLARHIALFAVCAATLLLQAVFRRPGPPVTAQDWTYPSGHVAIMTAIGFTAVLASRSLSRTWRVVVASGSAAALGLVAASRVALGEHYVVDVVAAAIATTGTGLLAATLLGLLPVARLMPQVPRTH